MEEKDKNIGDAFMEVVMNKIEKQDKKISGIEEKFQDFAPLPKQLDKLTQFIDQSKVSRDNLQTVEAKSKELLEALQDTRAAIVDTRKQPIQHHHRFPKLLWVTAGLLIALSISISDLCMTYKKLNGYIANDSKYRYLKLDTTWHQKRLYTLDSIYNADPDFRKRVIEMEEDRQYRLEESSKAALLRKEAEEHDKNARQTKPVK